MAARFGAGRSAAPTRAAARRDRAARPPRRVSQPVGILDCRRQRHARPSTTRTMASSRCSRAASTRRSPTRARTRRSGGAPRRSAELDRAKTAFFSQREPRVPHAAHADARARSRTLLAGARRRAAPEPRAARGRSTATRLRLLKLVNTLLDFSRIEAGRAQACYEPTDLARAHRGARERLPLRRSSAPGCGSSSTARRSPSRSTSTATCGRRSSSTCSRTRSSSRFEGRDRGDAPARGRAASSSTCATPAWASPRTSCPRVFERFHRVEGAAARTHEGTGIGLALVQRLAQLHGGTIAVESEVGRGHDLHASRSRWAQRTCPPERIGATQPASPTAVRAQAPSSRRRCAGCADGRDHGAVSDGAASATRRRRSRSGARILAGRRQRRHARLRHAPARRSAGRSRPSPTATAALAAARRERARPRPHRRDDAGARRLRAPARAARDPRTRARPGHPALGARGRGGARRGARGRRRRLPGQAVLGARAAGARVDAPRARPRARASPTRGAERRRLCSVHGRPGGHRVLRGEHWYELRQRAYLELVRHGTQLVGKPVREALPELARPGR